MAAGFKHLRYVDDIRIFCQTNLEAKQALLKLNQLLRNAGLNLQTAKTQILRLEKARQKIDGITPTLEAITEQLAEELRETWNFADASGTLSDIDALMQSDPEAPKIEVLEKAFHEYFSSGDDKDFDKTLFHFLLTRLGRTGSRVAVSYCLELIASRPEETSSILRYFEKLKLDEDEILRLVSYAASDDALYDYQLFEIVRWFIQTNLGPPAELIGLCRRWWDDKNRAPWLRTWSLVLLGRHGEIADLENIENQYARTNSELEKAEIVAALARMEPGRRNAFFVRVKEDGDLINRAVNKSKVKNKRRP